MPQMFGHCANVGPTNSEAVVANDGPTAVFVTVQQGERLHRLNSGFQGGLRHLAHNPEDA